MPTTYAQIASTTVASTTNTVTFNGIDGTYTDLVLVMDATATTNFTNTKIIINSDTGTNYSWVNLKADGSSVTSSRSSANTADLYLGLINQGRGTYRFVFNNYANTSMYKHIIASGGLAGNRVEYGIGQWRNTNAITSIQIVQPADTFTVGSTFTLYGIRSASYGAKATGGVITSDANYYYHTFLASGTFMPTSNITADYLVVAGGGGGAGGSGGGGGAGGLRCTVGATGGGGSLESALSLTSGTAYTVTVGAGGSVATNGSNSVFSTITSTGGGAGGGGEQNGATGGSGGGGGNSVTIGGSGTANQGFAGGNGRLGSGGGGGGDPYSAGGGGGASSVGANATISGSGNGGAGVATSISGSSVTYAGGGGGGADAFRKSPSGGLGGSGGGGNGGATASASGVAGTVNTGGGGGGGANVIPVGAGAAGGSGIVIVRYSR